MNRKFIRSVPSRSFLQVLLSSIAAFFVVFFMCQKMNNRRPLNRDDQLKSAEKSHYKLVIAIMSAPTKPATRQVIRETWLSQREPGVKHLFIVGTKNLHTEDVFSSSHQKQFFISPRMCKVRIGIVGFGHLGQFLYNNLIRNDKLEVVFIWNRSKDVFSKVDVPAAIILEDLENFAEREADLIVEVAHPCISQQFGKLFLEKAHYFVGSPTALADKETYDSLSKAAESFKHKVLIPNGALWGGEDIRRMALQGSLKGLTITMSKHPSSFKLLGTDQSKLDSLTEPMTVYEGSVRELCPLAPNNVNTMAAAAVAAFNLGFDGVKGRIIADPSLKNWHVIEVEATGPAQSDGRTFSVKTVRRNPADPGAVTGTATFNSFMASLVNASSRISDGTYGFQLC